MFQPPTRRPLSPNRPTIAAALRANWWGSIGSGPSAAATHELYAVDLDIRSSFRSPANLTRHPALVAGPVRLRSVWIPGSIAGPWLEPRADRLWQFLGHAMDQLGLRTIILPRSGEVERGTHLGPELRKRVDAHADHDVRVAIGIRASTGRHGHDQLVEFLNLRHAAEEWDLDLALDLTGSIPPTFEAEAAVLRLLPRLTIVRMPSWVSANGQLAGNHTLTRRVVATLADHGYRGVISIEPSTPLIRLPLTVATASGGEEWTRQLILEQYDRRLGDASGFPVSPSEIFREHL